MTFGLVDVDYSLPEGQAVKLIFFAPCNYIRVIRVNSYKGTIVLNTGKMFHAQTSRLLTIYANHPGENLNAETHGISKTAEHTKSQVKSSIK